MFTLKNKTALITGATGKLNRQLAKRLAGEGASLALHYNTNEQVARELVDQIQQNGVQCFAYQADLTKIEDIHKMVDSVLADFEAVDILINGASKFIRKSLDQTDDKLWQEMLDLHVTAPYKITKLLADNFRERESAIINFTDIWGQQPSNAFFAYSVSKGALITLTKTLARQLAPNTTVNAIAPGIIHFPEEMSSEQQKAIIKRIPMQRVGTIEEVVELTISVLKNRYITGQVLTIDGGRTL